jgi:ketosteroid isomerase-like protein
LNIDGAGAIILQVGVRHPETPADPEATMTLKALLAAFTAAVEKGDGNALADCFTADGVYDDYFFGPSKPGREGIVEMLAHFYEGGKDFRWDFYDIAEAGDLGYASYCFSYTSTLPEVKGTRVAFEGISRMTLAGGGSSTTQRSSIAASHCRSSISRPNG